MPGVRLPNASGERVPVLDRSRWSGRSERLSLKVTLSCVRRTAIGPVLLLLVTACCARQRLVQCLVYSSHFLVPEAWTQRQLTGRCITHSFERSEIGCEGKHVGLIDGSDHPEAVLKFCEVVIVDLERPTNVVRFVSWH